MSPEQRGAIVEAAGAYGDASYEEGKATTDEALELAQEKGTRAWSALLAALGPLS